MADNRVRLIHEIDATPSLTTAQQVEQRWGRTHDSIDKGAQKTARTLSQAMRAMSAGIGAMTAGAAGAERQWLSLGTSILASFAAGGPIVGGIAAVAGGIGLLAGKAKETGDEWEAAFKRMRAEAERTELAIADMVRAAEVRLFEARGGSSEAFRILEIEEEIFKLKDKEPDPLRRSAAAIVRIQELERERDALNKVLDFERKIREERLKRDEEARTRAQRNLDAMPFEKFLGTDMLPTPDDVARLERWTAAIEELDRRKRLMLDVPFNELLGTDLLPFPDEKATEEFVGTVSSPPIRVVRTLESDFQEWQKTFGPQISGTLATAIADGGRTGFKNLTDIGLNFFSSLVAQLSNLLITSGLRSVVPSLFAVAKGAAFAGGRVVPFARGGVVDRPTLFPMANGMGLMGEAGPEAVLPLRRGRGGRLGVEAGGGGLTINLGGVTLSRDFRSLPEEEQRKIVGELVVGYINRSLNGRTMLRRGGV